jgi:hypothetical protein
VPQARLRERQPGHGGPLAINRGTLLGVLGFSRVN